MPVEMIGLFMNFALMFVVLWFFVLRPEKKRRQQLSLIEKGDRVVTMSGIHGRVHNITDTTMSLINDQGNVWVFERSAISRKID